ncbi:MAG TPA: hypothetical protein VFU02_23875 [Polyangiaceae bacterium]|nr:hypothetical protein [Polyangiaceae bacterium]
MILDALAEAQRVGPHREPPDSLTAQEEAQNAPASITPGDIYLDTNRRSKLLPMNPVAPKALAKAKVEVKPTEGALFSRLWKYSSINQ